MNGLTIIVSRLFIFFYIVMSKRLCQVGGFRRFYHPLTCDTLITKRGLSSKRYSDSYVIRNVDIEDYGRKSKVTYIDEGPDTYTGPPLVIIGGTAQTINTYTMHIKPIARVKRLVIIEMRGQGSTELQSQYANMKQHVADLGSITDRLGIQTMFLSGFSFGGRVAAAFAAHNPDRVVKLSVTGIPYQRPKLGQLILNSWAEALGRGNTRECAWSFILNGYSEEFIEKYGEKLPPFVDMVVEANNVERLYDLIRLSAEGGEEYTLPHCAPLIKCPTQVIAATNDRIAGYDSTLELQKHLGGPVTVQSIKAGHLAPFEQPSQWRKALLDFIDS